MKHGKHAKGNALHMNKKLFAFASAVVVCCALAIGGTLAFYSAEEKAHNVITSGGVDIALNEWQQEDDGTLVPFEDQTDVMPGVSVSKIVEVENIGPAPAWIRVKADKAIQLADGTDADASVATMDFNETAWTYADGWWYYNQILPAGQTTEPLFTAVTFAAHMGNEYQESKATVDVTAQAVQSDNNSDSVLTATGWPQAL